MSIEKRAHARIAAPVSVHAQQQGQEVDYLARDISRGGLFVYTRTPPEVGTVLSLKIGIAPDVEPLSLRAEVIRIAMDVPERGGGILGMGLQFVELTAEQQRALEAVLKRARSLAEKPVGARPRHLLDLTCRSDSELRALIREIGKGLLGMTVDRALPPGQEVTVEVQADAGRSVKVTGSVASCQPLPEPGRFRARIGFTQPDQAQGQLSELLTKP